MGKSSPKRKYDKYAHLLDNHRQEWKVTAYDSCIFFEIPSGFETYIRLTENKTSFSIEVSSTPLGTCAANTLGLYPEAVHKFSPYSPFFVEWFSALYKRFRKKYSKHTWFYELTIAKCDLQEVMERCADLMSCVFSLYQHDSWVMDQASKGEEGEPVHRDRDGIMLLQPDLFTPFSSDNHTGV